MTESANRFLDRKYGRGECGVCSWKSVSCSAIMPTEQRQELLGMKVKVNFVCIQRIRMSHFDDKFGQPSCTLQKSNQHLWD